MINAVVVEDEYMIAKRLKRFVDLSFQSQGGANTRIFHQLDDASEYLSEHHIDVLFLDLNLNGKDGFNLLQSQLSKGFQTIVVSANTDRAIEAFDLGVLDFIGKPFTQERIDKAVARLFSVERKGSCKYLTYQTGKQLKMLPIASIKYLRADGHYTEVYHNNEDSILHEKNLEALLTILPPQFFRIHRSYAVNLEMIDHLTAHSGSKYTVTLTTGQNLPVGRTKVQSLRMAMQER